MAIKKKQIHTPKAELKALETLACPTMSADKEPGSWTIITALNRVLDEAEDSQLRPSFFETCKSPLAYLRQQLSLTDIQIVVLAFMIESGQPVTWKSIGNFLKLTRLSIMTYSEEIEQLVTKRWAMRKMVSEFCGRFEGFGLASGVVTALRHNEVFVPEKIDDLTEQQFVDKLENHVSKNMHNQEVRFSDDEEGLLLETINELYPEECECDFMRSELREGTHVLIDRGYIEHKCVDGQVDNERYVLTRKTKELLLAAYTPRQTQKKTSTTCATAS